MKYVYLLVFCFISNAIIAQTSLSGEMSFLNANAVSFNLSDASILVDNNPGFAEGDKILVIQMQGAIVDLSNSSNFGHVNDYNGAGSYEIAQICSIDGTTLILDYFLANNYDPSGIVQVIKIPYYDNVSVDDVLSAPEWDGTSGGVLVLEADNIDLNADINMSGKGFRGGNFINSTISCNWFQIKNDYFYDNSDEAALKGEGIAVLDPDYIYGKGASANGGGGGNDHNAGGGGGSNGVAGGIAGKNGDTGMFNCKGQHPGAAGYALNTLNSLFLGGGGGAGQGNNNMGTSGATGGGIIILIANSLSTNGYKLISNGLNVANTLGGDGGGGGGAGGSIHLDIPSVVGTLNIESTGGDGGSVYDNSGPRCWGPGGGGAGGVFKISGNSPTLVTYDLAPGQSGVNLHNVSSCTNSTSDGMPGINGLILENQSIPTSTIDNTLCNPLPIELVDFNAKAVDRKVLLTWRTLSEENNHHFTIERSRDGSTFHEVDRIAGAGTSFDPINYSFLHESPWSGRSYYRLKQTDTDGMESLSKVKLVMIDTDFDVYSIFPNPVKEGTQLNLEILAIKSLDGQVAIYDLLGSELRRNVVNVEEGFNVLSIDVNGLSTGTYILRFSVGRNAVTRRIVIY